jgi:C-terminal processing protease CtpA/Prc
MTKTHLWGASALVGLSLLFTQTSVMAQNTGGQSQPQAPSGQAEASKQQTQPRADAPKQADKPKSDASKQADKPKSDASKQVDKPKSDAGQKDKSAGQSEQKSDRPVDPQTTDRSRASDGAADRSRDRASDRATDRSSDRSRQQSTDRPQQSDRSRQQSTDRSRQQTDRSSQQTDRSRLQSNDRSRQPTSERSTARRSQDLTAKDLGFAFSSESSDRGLVIDDITSKSIASRAEFHEGDIIVSIHDHRITSQRDFIRYIDLDADERIPVVVLRDDREVTVYLDPTVIREEVVVSGHGWLGVDLEDREVRAAVVHRVHPGSPAERAGLRSGDLILAVEGIDIRSPQHLGEVIGGMRPGSEVEIEVDRGRRSMFVDATLGEKQEVATRRTEIR